MKRLKLFLAILLCLANIIVQAQTAGSISGHVADETGAAITGASVVIIDNNLREKSALTDKNGDFTIDYLPPGKYATRVTFPKFDSYEESDVEVIRGKDYQLTVILNIHQIKAEVQVENNVQANTDADDNANATILKDKSLDDLPDDTEELEAYLRALAGPAAGPDGGQIIVDGFTGGRFPPKEAIREIRINSNPFSAEFDRMGLSRIEVFTKPGFDKWRGSVSLNFNDARFNSRNPFAFNRAPAQTRNFSGYLSGPVKKKKASFFVDLSRSQLDRSSTVTAIVLDPSLNIVNLNQDYKIPTRRFSISPRIDYQINEKNNLTFRYSFTRSASENQGVFGFSLLSRAYSSSDMQHNIQLTESAILNSRTVNETRFQYEFYKREQTGDNTIPTINVFSAFTGGGSQVGHSFNKTNRWEFQNYTTTSFGQNFEHSFKFGIRIRGIKIRDHSESGYGGSFSFAGVRDSSTGEILYSSIEQYRQKILGNPNPIFNPSQFSVTTGNPDAIVSQTDYGVFVTDDWRARKNLTLSLGVRYENQTNLRDNLNLAPRIGIAWSPAAKDNKPSKTVFRGAFGIFYDRFSENTVLRARRNDGASQLQYYVSDSGILGQATFTPSNVRNVPTAAQLKLTIPLASTPFRISDDLKVPRSIETVFSVERSLPYRSMITATFFTSNSRHTLRQRNINAPVCSNTQICPAILSFQQILSLRPDPAHGNIYQVESSGSANTQQLLLKFTSKLNAYFSFFANYTLSFSKGTTDGFLGATASSNSTNFPAYSYDFNGEYAPSSFVAIHNLNANGTVSLPFEVRVSPTIIFSSGRRFNIVTGIDTNHDSVFTERPTYAVLRDRCLSLKLNNSFCDINGISNFDTTIPRNYGKGPGSFIFNLNLSKTFGFGTIKTPVASTGIIRKNSNVGTTLSQKSRSQRTNWFSRLYRSSDQRKRYGFTVGVNVQNVFNNVNQSAPTGNLSSPFFGRSTSTGGNFGFYGGGNSGSYNRRVDLSLRFSF